MWPTLGRKISQKPSWLILVNFGRARIDQNLVQMDQDGAKIEPRWRQDPLSRGQDGHVEAIWAAILSIFGGLGSELYKNGRSRKSNDSTAFLLHFRVLERLVGGSWAYFERSWRQVGLSWAILGVKLGTCWQHVGSKMAKDGVREPT